MSEPLHAWFSEKQRRMNSIDIASGCVGTGVYHYRKSDGTIVCATEVMSSTRPSNWEDAVYLGIVEHFVSREELSREDQSS